MTVPSHAVGDLDDVDDRLDALRKRLARGSDVSITVGTAHREEEGRVSPERLSRESSKELSVPPAASGPRDERPPRPRRTEPVDIMPSPTARSPRHSSLRSSTTAATISRRWSAHYDVNTTPALTSPGGGRERAAAYGSPARFGIVPISPTPSLGALAGDGDGLGRSIHDGRGDSTHRHSTRRDDSFGDNRAGRRPTTSIGDDDATVTMTLRERDEIHAKIVRLTEERDASRAECASLARNLTATTTELDRTRSRYADVSARLDAVAEDLAAHRARVGSIPRGGGFAAAAGAHPALAGATADARVAASELRAAVEDLAEKSIDDDLVGRRRVAGVVRERTRALIARAEDVAVAAMGELAAAASREASREATGGRRFKLPIY